MTDQGESGIPFEISTEQQYLRLLELPPSILNSITSDNPESLSVKSALVPVPTPNGLKTATAPQAVLCTKDETYQLRQVHTSNSIFVLQPTSGRDTELDNASSTTGKVTAISRCGATLELIPVSAPPKTVLLQSLPLFSDVENLSAVDPETPKSKEALLNDTPLSSYEFEKGWIELCAFELGGRTWRPSAPLLLQIWASLMSAVTLKGLDLEQGLPLSALAPAVEEDGHPLEVLKALLARLCKPKRETHLEFDKHICIRFVGAIMLESQTKLGVQLDTADFLRLWKDQLPEAWRKEALLEALGGSYVQPTQTTISFNDTSGVLKTGSVSMPTNDSGPRSRKWHEKFKQGRH